MVKKLSAFAVLFQSFHVVIAVAAGALLALLSVAAIGATTGQQLVRYLPVRLVQRIAAVIFAGLAM